MKKSKLRNILTTIFCAALCAGAVFSFPFKNNKVAVSADDTPVKQSSAYLDLTGSGKILNAFEGEQKENVYFGTYSGSAMKWRVLAKKDGKYGDSNNNLLLWSEKVLSKDYYNLYTTNPNYAYWGTSYIRARLNGGEYLEYIKGSTSVPGFTESPETTTTSYIKSLFNDMERNGVKTSTYNTDGFVFTTTATSAYNIYLKNGITETSHDNNTSYYYYTDELQRESAKYVTTATNASNVQESTSDKLFLLDYYDVNNENYGFYDLVEGEKQTYASKVNPAWPDLDFFPGYYDNNNRGTINAGYLSCTDSVSSYYWLRHGGRTNAYDSIALVAGSTGNVWTDGVGSGTYGIRPAFVLDTNKIAYATTVKQTGSWSDLSQLSSKPEYKLYLKHSNYVSNAKAVIGAKNNTLNIRYNNPMGRSDGKLLVLLSDKSKGDGSIAWQTALDMESTSANDYVFKTVSLPAGVSLDTHNVTLLYTSDNKDYATESIYCSYEAGGITAPTDIDDSGIVYDKNCKWISNLGDKTPDWVDTNIYCNEAYMSVSAITYKSMAEGATPVPLTALENGKLTDLIVNAGEYEITMALADGVKWSDGSTDSKSFKIKIYKTDPTVTATVGTTGSRYVTQGLPINEDGTANVNNTAVGGTEGSFTWCAEPKPSTSNSSYKCLFTPNDTNNYNTIECDNVTVLFVDDPLDSLKVEITPTAGTLYTSYALDKLKSAPWNMKVLLVYESGYEKETTDYTIKVMVDGSPQDYFHAGNNTVRVTSNSKRAEFEVEVIAAAINAIDSVDFNQNGAKIYPDTALSSLKEHFTVEATWNYNTSTVTELASSDYELEGTLVPGTGMSTLYIVYTKDGDVVKSPVPNGALNKITVDYLTYDMEGVGFEGKTDPVYDGNPHALTLSKELPDGVECTITYKKEGEATASPTAPTDAGKYTVTASFTGDTVNYKPIESISVTLTIGQKPVDMTGVEFKDKQVFADGSAYTLTITGTLPTTPENIQVSYSVEGQSGTSFTAEGTYKFTATFTHTNGNYKTIEPMHAELEITSKLPYDMTGVSASVSGGSNASGDKANGFTVTYSGSDIEINLSNLPDGVSVDQTVYTRKQSDDTWSAVTGKPCGAGEYKATVSFGNSKNDHATPQNIEILLTIGKADVDMSGVSFENSEVVYDGKAHTLEISGTLPERVTVIAYTVEGQSDTSFTEIGEYIFTVTFTNPDADNYNDIPAKSATLKIIAATVTGITATVKNDVNLNVLSTLDDLKSGVLVTINLTGDNTEAATDFELACDTLRDGGHFEVGQQQVTVKFVDTDGTEYTTTVTVTVNKAKLSAPVYSGTLCYTGSEIKPKASDFEGVDGSIMALVESKLQGGVTTGSYRAVFALTDTARYDWDTTKSYSLKLYKKALFDDETAEIQLDDNEIAVEWSVAKAVVSATKATSGLPVFSSASYKGAWGDAVSIKYFTDETCTTEVASNALESGKQYYAQVALLDTANFALDDSLSGFISPFPYTAPVKSLSFGEKALNFLKNYWLWIVLAVAVILLIVIIASLCSRAARRRREREEERMMRYGQHGMPYQSMPMGVSGISPELLTILTNLNAKIEMMQNNNAAANGLPAPTPSTLSSPSPELLTILNGMNAKIDKLQSDMNANELASTRDALAQARNEQLRSEIRNVENGGQNGVSTDKITQAVNAAVKSALAENAAADKARDLGSRPLVEPIDDDKVVDWGGFYNLADEQDLRPLSKTDNKKK